METSSEVSTVVQPAVTKNESSVTESSHESKVEKIANGTVETAASSEKTVTQSVTTSNDSAIQQNSVVEEVKQQSSFTSSSVIVDEKPLTDVQQNDASDGTSEVVDKSLESENVRPVENSVESESDKLIENSVESEKPIESSVDTENAKPIENSIEPVSAKSLENSVESGNAKPIENSVEAEKQIDISVNTDTTKPIEKSVEAEKPLENSVEAKSAKPLENSVEQEASKDTNEIIEQESYDSIKEVSSEPIASAQSDSLPESKQQVQEAVVEKVVEQEQSTNSQSNEIIAPQTQVDQPKVDEISEQVKSADDSADQGDSSSVPISLSEPLPVIPEQSSESSPTEQLSSNNLPLATDIATAHVAAEPKQEVKQEQEVSTGNEQHLQQFSQEIAQESIKRQLNEIITDIEKNVQISNDDATEISNDEHGERKKSIDLQKIFTPANDVEEIKPGKNRKLFASSSFYSPTIHPTVEDQVELARRISHSLSDISNHQSKGQSMYVNRKKRSVKWIHDDGHEEERFIEEHQETKENGYETSTKHVEHSTSQHPNGTAGTEPKKVPLKLVMDPRHVQDFNSMRQFGYEPAPMSPEFGIELCNALNAPNGKGAELFAKRRKKAEKWVVDGSKTQQQQTPTPGVPFVPAFSEAGIQRVQQNLKMDAIQEKYLPHPSVKMVKSPWEAALETGSADNAFVSYDQQLMYSSSTGQVQQYDYGTTTPASTLNLAPKKDVQFQSTKQFKEQLSGRDLAYRPSVPQGWNRPQITLQPEFSQYAQNDDGDETEMSQIYDSAQSYLELIRDSPPTPPVIEYNVKIGDVETNVYEEPIKELIIESESRESTPEYQTVPVKTLITTFEQGIFTPPEIPIISSTTSSITSSEKISKFSSTSTTSTSFQDVFSSESSSIKQEQIAPAPIAPQHVPVQQVPIQQPVSAPAPFTQQFYQQQLPRPYPGAGQSYPPVKTQTPVSFSKPQTPTPVVKPQTPTPVVKPQTPTPVVKPQTPIPIAKPQTPIPVAKPQTPVQMAKTVPISTIAPAPMKPMTPSSLSSRSSYNASPVTPGILKKQMQLDAAVPVPPGGIVPSHSPASSIHVIGKSPVPFINTAPAPFAPQFPALSVQTPETISQIAPVETPLVPPLADPAHIPMPLIVNTPLPKFDTSYNNAARPFNEFKDYYRPIHMKKGKKLLPPLIYTDF